MPLDYDRVAMLNRFRQFWTKVITPIATLLLKLGVSADMVTLVGTIGVSAGALIFFLSFCVEVIGSRNLQIRQLL